jgi:tetratricopeptide (TPR) repeat protein
MSIFQLFLLLLAGSIFYMFFKQLFSGDYPKRGIDFEAKLPDENIGTINNPQKTFAKPEVQQSRLEELLSMADESVEKGDMLEARKAIDSALIVDGNNPEVLKRAGYLYYELGDFADAKEHYSKLLEFDSSDDMAHNALANSLHKLGLDDEAITHHKKAIELDSSYAPYYYNYANTLYDMARYDEALELYKKAYRLDDTLKSAKEMIDKLEARDE